MTQTTTIRFYGTRLSLTRWRAIVTQETGKEGSDIFLIQNKGEDVSRCCFDVNLTAEDRLHLGATHWLHWNTRISYEERT